MCISSIALRDAIENSAETKKPGCFAAARP
jgi:hypothetical protein